mmetsp:Transcript_4821/g.18061  ORF Transcript_4821/g.18061 Transcript_4821/m.18061 type:complete len:285 (-) Transcript_4821:362-1216(-)
MSRMILLRMRLRRCLRLGESSSTATSASIPSSRPGVDGPPTPATSSFVVVDASLFSEFVRPLRAAGRRGEKNSSHESSSSSAIDGDVCTPLLGERTARLAVCTDLDGETPIGPRWYPWLSCAPPCVGDRAFMVGDATPYALALRAACSRRYSSTTSSARDLPRALRRSLRSSSSSSLISSAIMSARVLWSTARRICDARSCVDASLSRRRRVSSRDQSSRRRTSLASAIAAAPSAPAPPSTPRTSSSMALRMASAAFDALDACANCLRSAAIASSDLSRSSFAW